MANVLVGATVTVCAAAISPLNVLLEPVKMKSPVPAETPIVNSAELSVIALPVMLPPVNSKSWRTCNAP